MIKNEQSYQATKEWIARFEEQLASPLPKDDPIDPRARRIERDAINSMIEDLRDQLRDYETHQLQLQTVTAG